MKGHPRIEAARRAGRPLVFGWVTDGGAFAMGLFRSAGYEFLCLDCQHSCLTEADAAALIARDDPALPVFVRVSANDAALIGRVCDAGADGVIVPAVESAADAARAVAAVRYPPGGRRSFGPIRADLRGAAPQELADRVSVFALIETPAGVEHVDEICGVPGLAGAYLGPADLSIGLGLDPRAGATTDHLAEHADRVRKACVANGLVFGMHQPDAVTARRWLRRGAELVTIATDAALLRAAAAAELAALKEETLS